MEPYQISIIGAIVFGIVEMLTLTLIFLGFASGMLVVAITQFATGGYVMNRDLLLWIVASTVFVIVLRKLFKKQSDQTKLDVDDISQY